MKLYDNAMIEDQTVRALGALAQAAMKQVAQAGEDPQLSDEEFGIAYAEAVMKMYALKHELAQYRSPLAKGLHKVVSDTIKRLEYEAQQEGLQL